jgi:hypothetical protein
MWTKDLVEVSRKIKEASTIGIWFFYAYQLLLTACYLLIIDFCYPPSIV